MYLLSICLYWTYYCRLQLESLDECIDLLKQILP